MYPVFIHWKSEHQTSLHVKVWSPNLIEPKKTIEEIKKCVWKYTKTKWRAPYFYTPALGYIKCTLDQKQNAPSEWYRVFHYYIFDKWHGNPQVYEITITKRIVLYIQSNIHYLLIHKKSFTHMGPIRGNEGNRALVHLWVVPRTKEQRDQRRQRGPGAGGCSMAGRQVPKKEQRCCRFAVCSCLPVWANSPCWVVPRTKGTKMTLSLFNLLGVGQWQAGRYQKKGKGVAC